MTAGAVPVTVSVFDTGRGIQPDRLSEMFERFTQEDSSATRQRGGAGLGLAISKSLVELMGGQIEAASEPGKGSTFRFTLPLVPVAASAPNREPDRTDSIHGARILVVEDNRVSLLVVQRMLEKLGCRVQTASNGYDALAWFGEGRYDAVLMDCHMPKMDGHVATARIRSLEASGVRTPILALTADAMEGNRKRCLKAGMDDFLAKPVDRDELVRLLARWVRPRRQAATS